jgi:GDPmannose 4,6-dehydratase
VSKILITGVTGQDGRALAAQCLSRGDEVYGLVRWESGVRRMWVQKHLPEIQIIDGDLEDASSLRRALEMTDPDIVYNLAALASSGQSWAQPMVMGQINALGPLRLLEAIRYHNPGIRFVQASTSEQYGRVNEQPQNEKTPFGSLNVYGIAKTFAHQATINYRDSYNMHASTALMHNHVSYARNPYFVDRKITMAVARIKMGLQANLTLGNTEAARDWGWGPEYMQAWHLITERDVPDDYVICTGQSHTVQEFVEKSFARVDLTWAHYVVTNPKLYRPTDVLELRGDPSFTYKTLGWKADILFDEIVEMMVDHDMHLLGNER